MTSCFKLARTLSRQTLPHADIHCTPCVYFSKNLDPAEYPVLMNDVQPRCGLWFLPGDEGCSEMRTDNCSARKR